DIPSREALEEVLASYEGALFVVSHDRYLLKRLGDRVVAIRDGAAHVLDGDFAAYEERQHDLAANADAPRANGSPAAAKNDKTVDRRTAHETKQELMRRRRAVSDAEKRVNDLDAKRAKVEEKFAAPDLYDDPQRVVELQHELDRIKSESEAAMAAWEAAVEALEASA
ncbi:MAG TPA: hypothetical protein VMA36_21850, partial [Candidatus Limnocylindria bacterium]|nr:hypothetical protein [Candidatus Limnocylindria bacterium]